jgi:NitT/TauT family transport system substrate-binding protein
MMRVIAYVIFLLACSLAFGCTPKGSGGEGGKGEAKKVKLALNWVPEPEFGGFFAAREGKAYEKHGLDVEILNGGAGVPVAQMVASGQADFGVVSSDELINARTRGADLIPLYAIFQTNPHAIMAHASRGAKKLADVLSSGTLAVEPGAPFAAFLKKKYGFDGVTVVPYDGGVARFVADKSYAQQCFATSEPLAARKAGADPVVFLVADEGFNPYAAVVATRRELWQKSPDIVRAFVRASREGWQSYLADPKPANAVMAKLNTTMDEGTFAAVADAQRRFVESDETRQRGLGVMRRERWEEMGRILADLGIITAPPAADDYLVTVE